MGLISSIKSSDKLALDTNIFVYAYQGAGKQVEIAKKLLEKIRSDTPKTYISVLVFEEFLVKIYKKGLEKDLALYEDFLTAGGLITVVDINRQIARQAAKLRAEYTSLRAPDAIHLASAMENDCKTFVTADKSLPRSINKLKIRLLE